MTIAIIIIVTLYLLGMDPTYRHLCDLDEVEGNEDASAVNIAMTATWPFMALGALISSAIKWCIAKPRYYNEMRISEGDGALIGDWLPYCQGHSTMLDAIECQEEARQTTGKLFKNRSIKKDKREFRIMKKSRRGVEIIEDAH